MAVRIQLRRDTASNWSTNNPVLRPGEVGVETDTLKFKIGPSVTSPAIGTAWNSITAYANITPTGLSNSLGNYILSADQGTSGGPAELDSNGDLIVPENSVILWNDAAYTYSTTLTATEPTADRTITFKNADGTVAFTSDIPSNTDSLSEGSTNKYFTDERAQDAISTALAAGTHTNITVTYDDSANSISLAAAPGYVDEQAVDAVAAALAAGTHTNITVGYNDAGNAISLTGAVTYTDENAQDAVGNAVGTGLSYNDSTGAISVDTSTIQARVTNVTDTEIGYLDGVTSAIQTQLNDKLASSTASTTYAPIASPSFTGGIYVTGNTTLEGDLTVTGTTTTVNTVNTAIADNMIYLNEGIHYEIDDVTGNGTNQTYTTLVTHDITSGMFIRVTGITPSGYNLDSFVEVLSVGNKTITVAGTFTGTYTSGGELISKGSTNPDLGFAGGYNDGAYHHAGLFRDASDGSWKFFQGYDPEPDGLFINTSDASFALAPLKVAGFEAASATIGDVSNTELQYLNGVTSAIQTQLDAKAATADIAELAQDAVGNNVGSGLAYTDSTGAIGVNYVALGNTLLEGVSGASYGLIGTSTYLDVKDTNGYNKEIELDIAAVKTQLNTDGYLTTSSTSTLTNKTLTSPKINEDVAVTATATELNILDGATLSTTELNYVDGVTSSIQTQLDGKAASNVIPALSSTVTLYSDTSFSSVLYQGYISSGTVDFQGSFGSGRVADIALLNSTFPVGTEITVSDGTTSFTFTLNNPFTASALGFSNIVSNGATGADGLITDTTFTISGLVSNSGKFLTNNGTTSSWAAVDALPSQTGNSGKYLKTDGVTASWGTLVVPITTGQGTLFANTETIVDGTALSEFTSIEYMLSLKQGSKIRTSKVIVQTDGTSVDMTEFAITETGGTMSGVVVSAATSVASLGNAILYITVTDAATTNVTVKFSKVAL